MIDLTPYGDIFLYTYSGGRYHPFAPRVAEVKFADIAWSLAHKFRWNGHARIPVSVAEHSVHVARMIRSGNTAENAKDAKKKESETSVKSENIFFELMGLLHDAHEAYLGDVPSPIKTYLKDRADWEAIEVMNQRVILEALGLLPKSFADPYAWVRLWAEKIHPYDVAARDAEYLEVMECEHLQSPVCGFGVDATLAEETFKAYYANLLERMKNPA